MKYDMLAAEAWSPPSHWSRLHAQLRVFVCVCVCDGENLSIVRVQVECVM